MPLANEGIEYLLDAAIRQGSQESVFYLRLCDDTLVATDTLTDIVGEPALANGYAPIPVNANSVDWPSLGLVSPPPGVEIISDQKIWTASGGHIPGVGTVKQMFLATTADNTGKLIGWQDLSQPRQVLDGDSMRVTCTIRIV